MKNKLKILIAASEASPLAKVGGLGDVIGALPKALACLGADIRIILPFYDSINRRAYKIEKAASDLYRTYLPFSRVPVYLVDHKIFRNKKIYGSALADGQADIKKFLFFSQAILPSLKAVGFKPDVIHLNDWHTAAVARPANKQGIKTMLTIHNLTSQGKISERNLLAEGILSSDIITTVSQTYAKEILTKAYGCGLEKILAKRKNDLYGILNGIDVDFFNPAADKLIAVSYGAGSLNKKSANKTALQAELGWRQDKNIALVGLVTRFVWQKGVDLITEKFLSLNCQFVFLGQGDKKYEQALTALAKKYPEKIKAIIKFDERLAHQIYAASDIFLVPSRFEPCGLTQMIAMRYGSVPVARATGGLKDTVDSSVGFSFKNIQVRDFYRSLDMALKTFYGRPADWRRLALNGMKKNFSWDKSAQAYLKLYKKISH